MPTSEGALLRAPGSSGYLCPLYRAGNSPEWEITSELRGRPAAPRLVALMWGDRRPGTLPPLPHPPEHSSPGGSLALWNKGDFNLLSLGLGF